MDLLRGDETREFAMILAVCLFLVLGLVPSFAAGTYYLALVAARWYGCVDQRPASSEPRTQLAILIPAHNEALGIAATIRSCLALDYPPDRYQIVVLADNCDDATAELAREMGVTCWERDDPASPGKGPALGWAFQRLLQGSADAFLVLDADCQLASEALRIVDAFLQAGDRVLQLNHAVCNPDASPISYAAGVGRTLEYDLFFAPKSRLGLSVMLVGTGMVLHRETLERTPWSSTSCAEDTEYTQRLAEQRQPVRFVANAHVRVASVESAEALRIQRGRWAAGNLPLGQRHALRLLWRGIRERNLLLADFAWTLLLLSRPLVLLHLAATLAVGLLLLPRWVPPRLSGMLAGLTLALVPLYGAYLISGIVSLGMNRTRAGHLLRSPGVLLRLCTISLWALIGPRSAHWARTPRR